MGLVILLGYSELRATLRERDIIHSIYGGSSFATVVRQPLDVCLGWAPMSRAWRKQRLAQAAR